MLTVGIVIPNFNGARFLRAALESALQPTQATVTCLLMDGGSKDDSVKIAREFGSRVEVVCERDEGQADAIHKGFARMRTDLVGWLNSDDVLLPGAIDRVVEAATADPAGVLFHGDAEIVDGEGRLTNYMQGIDLSYDILRKARGKIIQPGSFYRRSAIERCGGPRKEFYLLMDSDLWIRLLAVGPAHRLPIPLAQFRIHEAAKSSETPYRYYRETLRITRLHDPGVAGLGRKAWVIGRHFLQWKAGLRVNDRPALPPSRTPPHVWTDDPAAAADLVGAAVAVPTTSRDSADVVFTADVPRRDARQLRRPTVVLLAEGARVVEPSHAVSFWVGDSAQRAALERSGIPSFRLGPHGGSGVFVRALRVALGQIPVGALEIERAVVDTAANGNEPAS